MVEYLRCGVDAARDGNYLCAELKLKPDSVYTVVICKPNFKEKKNNAQIRNYYTNKHKNRTNEISVRILMPCTSE